MSTKPKIVEIEDKGVWILLFTGEKRFIPFKVFNLIKDSVSDARGEMKDIPKGLRWIIKKGLAAMNDEEYACSTLANMIMTVENMGGKILWEE